MLIDLREEVGDSRKVLLGKENGKAIRDKYDLDTLDLTDEIVEIVIDEDFLSLNMSFATGLFGGSILNLGKKKFLAKFIFSCNEDMKDEIEVCIRLKETFNNL